MKAGIQQQVREVRTLDDLKGVEEGDFIMIVGAHEGVGSDVPERYMENQTIVSGKIHGLLRIDENTIRESNYFFEKNGNFSDYFDRAVYASEDTATGKDERFGMLNKFLEEYEGETK